MTQIRKLWKKQFKPAKSNEKLPGINVNLSSKENLLAINGLGSNMADQIIAGRPWLNIDSLVQVKGINQVRIKQWKLRV